MTLPANTAALALTTLMATTCIMPVAAATAPRGWHECCSCCEAARGRCLVSALAGSRGKQAPMGGRGNTDLMQQRTLQTLYGYWNEVRAGRLAPQRLEIEPSRIAGILSETFMLERIDA